MTVSNCSELQACLPAIHTTTLHAYINVIRQLVVIIFKLPPGLQPRMLLQRVQRDLYNRNPCSVPCLRCAVSFSRGRGMAVLNVGLVGIWWSHHRYHNWLLVFITDTRIGYWCFPTDST